MRTQSISAQNFTAGQIKFVQTVAEKTSDELLGEYLPKALGKSYKAVQGILEEKPYDLFVSRAENMPGFIALDANVNFANVVSDNVRIKGHTSIVSERNLDRFSQAATEAMNSFEKSPEYSKLIKPENIFKKLWKNITHKN